MSIRGIDETVVFFYRDCLWKYIARLYLEIYLYLKMYLEYVLYFSRFFYENIRCS